MNPKLHVFATDGVGAYDPLSLQWWQNVPEVDPQGAPVTLPADGNDPFIGILRNNNGNTGYAIADEAQKGTGRDVWLFCSGAGGKTMRYWQNPAITSPLPANNESNQGWQSLATYLPTILPQVTGRTTPFFDIVFMSCGGNDAGVFSASSTTPKEQTPDAFETQFENFYANLKANGWIDDRYTQWFHGEPPLQFPAYMDGKWDGIARIESSSNHRFQVMASSGYETVVGDPAHFIPRYLDLFGRESAKMAMLGANARTSLRTTNYVSQLAPVIRGDIVGNGFDFVDGGKISLIYPGTTYTNNSQPDSTPAPAYLQITDDHNWDVYNSGSTLYSGILAPAMWYGGTQTLLSSTAVVASNFLFNNVATLKNATGVAITAGSFYSLNCQLTFEADNAAVSMPAGQVDIICQPTFTAAGTGAWSAGSYTSISSKLTVNAGATVTTRYGVTIGAKTGAGTLTNQLGVVVDGFTSGVNNTKVLLGTTTAPTGNWCIYQNDTVPSRFNGGVNSKIVVESGAGRTLTDADRTIYFTGATNGNYTLPASATAVIGRIYTLKNSSLTADTIKISPLLF